MEKSALKSCKRAAPNLYRAAARVKSAPCALRIEYVLFVCRGKRERWRCPRRGAPPGGTTSNLEAKTYAGFFDQLQADLRRCEGMRHPTGLSSARNLAGASHPDGGR